MKPLLTLFVAAIAATAAGQNCRNGQCSPSAVFPTIQWSAPAGRQPSQGMTWSDGWYRHENGHVELWKGGKLINHATAGEPGWDVAIEAMSAKTREVFGLVRAADRKPTAKNLQPVRYERVNHCGPGCECPGEACRLDCSCCEFGAADREPDDVMNYGMQWKPAGGERFTINGHECSKKRLIESLEGKRGGASDIPDDSKLPRLVVIGSDSNRKKVLDDFSKLTGYGLSHDQSDIDRRGIYLPQANRHWSLRGVPEQLENDATQEVYWELQKFIVLALKANPNVLECLYTPLVEKATPLAEELLSMKSIFLSRLVYQTYNGYVLSQFKKMQADLRNHGAVKWKHVMHLIRLLLSGIGVFRDGAVPVQVGEHRERLLAIRRGEMPWKEVEAWRLALHQEFDAAFAATQLPERPDYEKASRFLIDARNRAMREELP